MTTLITADLGSSLIKVIYSNRKNQPEPIGIRPEVVKVTEHQVRAQLNEYFDDPLRSMVVETGGETYALGEFAYDLNAIQYHELSKWSDIIPRVLGVIGMVASRLDAQNFEVKLCLMMPLAEALSHDRVTYLEALQAAARSFKFRGQTLSCQLTTLVTVEGAGLYAGHAAYLRSQKQNPETLDIPVLMAGERNTSLVIYRGGKLNPQLSSSTAGGFYKYAEQAIYDIGAQMSLIDLIGAIATGKTKIRVAGNDLVDISSVAKKVIERYSDHLVKLVRAKLPSGEVRVVCGGGGLHMGWIQLEQWFRDAGVHATYLSPILQRDIDAIFASYPLLQDQKMRFADAVGIYRVSNSAKQPATAAR